MHNSIVRTVTMSTQLSPTYAAASRLWPLIYEFQQLLPVRKGSKRLSAFEAGVTLSMLIILMVLTLGALYQHLKDPVYNQRAPKQRRLQVLMRAWVAVTLGISVLCYFCEACLYMGNSIMTGKPGASRPVRLVWFWALQWLCLCVEVPLGLVSVPAVLHRWTMAIVPTWMTVGCTDNRPLLDFVRMLDDIDTFEIIVTRVLFLGATYAMAAYGR